MGRLAARDGHVFGPFLHVRGGRVSLNILRIINAGLRIGPSMNYGDWQKITPAVPNPEGPDTTVL
jgi:hypothetical protein